MLIGLTGGIGSGKSTIANELSRRGFAVYDCDREAKRIIAENPAVQQQIIALFGEEAFVDGEYNTQYISKCVFSPPSGGRGASPCGRGALNAIIHPAVKEDIKNHLPLQGAGGLLFIESAILFESGLDALCDRIIIVDAPEDIRIARTIARDYHGEATPDNINKVRARIRAQQSTSGRSNRRRRSNRPLVEAIGSAEGEAIASAAAIELRSKQSPKAKQLSFAQSNRAPLASIIILNDGSVSISDLADTILNWLQK